jgi:phage head maturation protease
MTDEEINRKFDVVTGHMATLAVGLQTLTEKVDQLTVKVDCNANSVAALLAITEIQAGEIKELSKAVQAIDERTRKTDERLDVLVNSVERLISERNGQA